MRLDPDELNSVSPSDRRWTAKEKGVSEYEKIKSDWLEDDCAFPEGVSRIEAGI
jgi:hypothetical protein